MWYQASVPAPATGSEPVSLARFKDQSRVESGDEDELFQRMIASARAHIEERCGIRIAPRDVQLRCDVFDDFAKLPEAPVNSIASITYTDTAGATQTLSTSVYELRADVLDASIALKYGQTWPSIQPGSRITVAANIGFSTCPEAIEQAMAMMLDFWNENRGAVVTERGVQPFELPFSIDAMLINWTRNA